MQDSQGLMMSISEILKVIEISGWRHATVRRKLLLYRALIGPIAEMTEGRRGIVESIVGNMAGRRHRSHITTDRVDARLKSVVESIVIHSTHVREAALVLYRILGLLQTSAELPCHRYLTWRRDVIGGDLAAGSTAQPTLAFGTHDLPLNPSSIRRLTDSWQDRTDRLDDSHFRLRVCVVHSSLNDIVGK